MKQYFFLVIATMLAGNMAAQQFDFNDNDSWLAKPVSHKTDPAFDTSSAVGILDERKFEYKVEGKQDIFVYCTYHKIVKIKDDKGIEMFNKVYMYMSPQATLDDFKARALLAGGRVVDIDRSQIKDIEDEGRNYKIFAVDGLEKGAELEFQYTIKKQFYLFSSELFQSQNVPYQQEKFLLITPEYLKFSVKGYNGFQVSDDSVINEKRVVAGYAVNVPDMDEEKYAYADQYYKRVDYKLSYNLSKSSSVRLYTWKEFAKNAFSFYTTYSDKDLKAINDFVKPIKFKDGATDAEKILAAEEYIKTNINFDENLISEDGDEVAKIIKTRSANKDGIVKLFTCTFDKLQVPYQIVFASDRSGYPLDEELENWNRADNIVLYFTQTKKFMAPASAELRYPYIPYEYTGTKGLFLKPTSLGAMKTAVGTFAQVDMEPFDEHAHNMEAEISFNETLDTLNIKASQVVKGYPATQYRPIYVFLPEDKQDEASKSIIRSLGNSNDVKDIKIQNDKLTDIFDNKPLIISANIKNTEMLENAGNKVLLKIGDIIGPQEQMYQEKPRQLPVELDFPHVLDRKITLHIPDGYAIKNLSDINMNVSYKEGDVVTMGFESSFVQTGNTVVITINETYHNLRYPLAEFDHFKNVINASADFNKVVLVVEKK